MAQNVHLNGGPWHDRKIAMEDGRDHFHILEPGLIKTREGMYSRVQGSPGEFEWDGWRTHD